MPRIEYRHQPVQSWRPRLLSARILTGGLLWGLLVGQVGGIGFVPVGEGANSAAADLGVGLTSAEAQALANAVMGVVNPAASPVPAPDAVKGAAGEEVVPGRSSRTPWRRGSRLRWHLHPTGSGQDPGAGGMTLPLPCRVTITGLGRPWTASAGIGAQLPYPVPATPRREFSMALPPSFSILFHRPGCGGPGLGQSSLVCPRGMGQGDDLTRSPTPRDDSAGVGGISVMTRIGVAAVVPLAGWWEVVTTIPRWGV